MEENEKIEEEKASVENNNTEVVENIVTEDIPKSNVENESKSFSIASLVLGIVAFVATKTGLIALACAILAIVFGVKGQKKAGKGMAKAGMILGIIYVSLAAIGFILVTVVGIGLGAALFSAAM